MNVPFWPIRCQGREKASQVPRRSRLPRETRSRVETDQPMEILGKSRNCGPFLRQRPPKRPQSSRTMRFGGGGPQEFLFAEPPAIVRFDLVSAAARTSWTLPKAFSSLANYRPKRNVIISQSPFEGPQAGTCLFISYAARLRSSAWKNLTWLST